MPICYVFAHTCLHLHTINLDASRHGKMLVLMGWQPHHTAVIWSCIIFRSDFPFGGKSGNFDRIFPVWVNSAFQENSWFQKCVDASFMSRIGLVCNYLYVLCLTYLQVILYHMMNCISFALILICIKLWLLTNNLVVDGFYFNTCFRWICLVHAYMDHIGLNGLRSLKFNGVTCTCCIC
jgi:hypothetical protein